MHSEALEDHISAAQTHGENSDPDHEVGDLQDMLRAVWEIMTPEQREEALASDEFVNVLDAGKA